MATPDTTKNYLPYDWNGVVTANDIAIQNQPWSLGHQLGPTREQAAQQELEAWFRSRGLDPNQYYESAGVTPPQPGFNPAGGSVNTGKPLKQQTIYSGGRTAEQVKAQQQAAKLIDKAAVPFDRKEAKERGEAMQAANRAAGISTIPAGANGLALNAAMMANAQINGPNMLQTAYKPQANQSQSQTAYAAPQGNGSGLLQSTPGASTDGAVAGPLGQGAIGQATQGFLPPYLQPNGAGSGGSVNDVLAKYNTGGSVLPPLQTGAPPVNPIGTPPLLGAPLVTGGINTGAGFGKTAKMLELPYYLRQRGKAY